MNDRILTTLATTSRRKKKLASIRPDLILSISFASSQIKNLLENGDFILFSHLKILCDAGSQKPRINRIFRWLTLAICRNNVTPPFEEFVSQKADPPEGNDRLQKAEKAQVVLGVSPRPSSVSSGRATGVTRKGDAVPGDRRHMP